MNCGLLCGLFMVKHHGLIIIDLAVWILTFEQDPTSLEHELIIKCCCVVPIPDISFKGLSGTSEMEGLFPILRHQNGPVYRLTGKPVIREANCHIHRRMWVLLCASLRSLLRIIRTITSHNPIQGANYFIISIVAVYSL